MRFTISPWAFCRIQTWGCPRLIAILMLLANLCAAPDFGVAMEVVDDSGHPINLDAPARRIAPLYGGFADILLALGAGDLLISRTAADDGNPALTTLPATGTHMRPNIELVAALEPDLVLQMKGRSEAAREVDALRKLGMNVAEFEMNSFPQLFSATRRIGMLAGREREAEALVSEWQKMLSSLGKETQPCKKIRVFYEARYPNLLAAGQKGIVNDIISAAGGENVVRTAKRFARINEEELLGLDPDFYMAQRGPMNPDPGDIAKRRHYRTLRAVKSGNILIVDEKRFARPGPSSVEAAVELHRLLHGDLKEGQ